MEIIYAYLQKVSISSHNTVCNGACGRPWLYSLCIRGLVKDFCWGEASQQNSFVFRLPYNIAITFKQIIKSQKSLGSRIYVTVSYPNYIKLGNQ